MAHSLFLSSRLLLVIYATLHSMVSLTTAHSCSYTTEISNVYAPLPATARGPDLGDQGYAVESFGGGAYMVTDGGYQSFFLVSTIGVILVDNPPTLGRKLQYAIGNITDLPVTHFIYSHHHADHAGGAYLFINENTTVIAHAETKSLLRQVPDPKRPLPTITFRQNYTLHAGNQTLNLSYKGENHSPGNIYIYAPLQKVLMLVDVVYPGWVPFTELAVSTNIPGWIAAHSHILAYDFKHYIGGHLGRSSTRKDVRIQQEYVSDLLRNCNETIQQTANTTNPVLGPAALLGPVTENNPGNTWAQFRTYLDVAAEACANKTNEKWTGRLGGADVFGWSNAVKAIESLRIDYDVLGPFGVS